MPLKYRWCSVPITPPPRKIVADSTEARPADAAWTGPILEALEAELMQHIHLENSVLFPRATHEA